MAFNQNQGTDCFTRGYLMKVREEEAAKEKALAEALEAGDERGRKEK